MRTKPDLSNPANVARSWASTRCQGLEICGALNERVHMDLFGPLKANSPAGNKYIMVITDAFSKYTELVPIHNKEAATVARAFFEK